MRALVDPSAAAQREDKLIETLRSYSSFPEAYAERYEQVDFASYRRMLLDARSNGGPLLDAGCGPGRDAAAFALEVPVVVATDLSRPMLRLAAQRTTRAHTLQCDLRRIPINDAQIAAVWSMASLVHLSYEEIDVALNEFSRVLSHAGPLFVSVTCGTGAEWRPDGRGGRRWFQHHNEADFVARLGRAGFDVKYAETADGVATGKWINLLALNNRTTR